MGQGTTSERRTITHYNQKELPVLALQGCRGQHVKLVWSPHTNP
jgi:hypothetical protein